eukprot:6374177-Prymnesium_polylepis.1
MPGAHARLTRAALRAGLPMVSQRHALDEWHNVSWAEQTRRVAVARCGGGGARDGGSPGLASGGLVDARWCWAP